jgi:hypothetical protein
MALSSSHIIPCHLVQVQDGMGLNFLNEKTIQSIR